MEQEPVLTDFARELGALFKAAGGGVGGTLTLKKIVSELKGRGFKVTYSHIGDWRKGRSAPSDRHLPTALALIKYLQGEAAKHSPGYPQISSEGWFSYLKAAQHAGKTRQGGSGPRINETSMVRLFGHAAEVKQYHQPRDFSGRLKELDILSAFAADRRPQGDSYAMWQADPFSGKSALLAWFVIQYLSDGAGVDVVPYFITRRLGTDHPNVFRATMREQLAKVVGRGAPSRLEDLYGAAAKASRARGRNLLLVVDGLDAAASPSDGGWSIAAMLPKELPAGMRVVVSGRRHPPLPSDVPADHPLRDPAIVRRLTASPEVHVIRDMLKDDLGALLKDREVGRPLLGLLTAARGALSGEDLAELIGADTLPYDVMELLHGVTGRSIRPDDSDHVALRGPDWGDDPALRTYVLAHDELARVAAQHLGSGLTKAEEILHAWADRYREAGWPEHTPNYLLTGYTRLVQHSGGPEGLTSLVFDFRRQQRQMAGFGSDLALADIELAAESAAGDTPDRLAVLAAAAASRSFLLRHTRTLPREIPCALARLGDARRARALALASPYPSSKAATLAEVARVLSGIGHKQAKETAREAAAWANTARRQAPLLTAGDEEAEAVVAQAALALIASGQEEDGVALLRGTRGSNTERYEAWAQAAVILAPDRPAGATDLLDELEHQAEELAERAAEDLAEDPATPIQLWALLAAAAPDRRERLHDRMRDHARDRWAESHNLRDLDVLSIAAFALAGSRPEEAVALAGVARQRIEAACQNPASLSVEDRAHIECGFRLTLVRLVRALTGTGVSSEQARQLLEGVPEAFREGHDRPDFADTVMTHAEIVESVEEADDSEDPVVAQAQRLAREAVGLAERDREAEARQCVDQALTLLPETNASAGHALPWLPSLAGALARSGHPGDAEVLARALTGPGNRARALAEASMASAESGRVADARRLAQEAARAAVEGPDAGGGAWAVAAQALALVGEGGAADDLIDRSEPAERARKTLWRQEAGRVRVVVAAGLAAHDPAAAARTVDAARARLEATKKLPGRSARLLADLGELAATAPKTDEACRARLRQAIAGARAEAPAVPHEWQAATVLVDAVLRIGDGEDVASWLNWLERESRVGRTGQFPMAGLAVLYALLGETDEAERTAERVEDPEDRAEAFAAVAGHLGRVPARLTPARYPAGTDPFTQTLRVLALAASPDAPGAAVATAAFLRKAVSGPGWHTVLPVLAELAPGAVAPIRDITFAHLGIDSA
ncbi:hypothetical protein ACIA8H_32220 [Streptomyces goshikiensis]|uniref:hypothetical protein n=1 Tax=Streptomyces goshikiensis TaxID=1942 RepID=UPI00378E759A